MSTTRETPPHESALARVWSAARTIPVTLAVCVVVLVAGVITGALWQTAEQSGLVDQWGWGEQAFEEGRWWTVLTGMLIAPTPWMYILIIAIFVAGGGYLEKHFGPWRMLAVTVGTHVAAVLTVAGLFWVLRDAGLPWVDELSGVADVGLSNAGFGALGAVSAAMPLLWRRRVRLIGSVYCLVMILWAAEVWDFTHAAAFFIGLAVGPWVVGRAYERWSIQLGAQEVRDIAAVILTVSALQTILVHVWPGEGGILEFGHPEVPASTLLGDLGVAVINLTFAYAIHRGSRLAWWLVTLTSSVGLLAGVAVSILEPGPNVIFLTLLELVLVVTLIGGRRHFQVRGARGVRSRIWGRVGIAAAATLLFTTSAILTLDDSFDREPTVGDALATSLMRLFGITDEGLLPETTASRVLLGAVSLLWWAVIAVSVAGILLTSRRHETTPEAREAFIALQNEDARMTSIGYMARWQGIDHWVSDSADAAWGFKLVGGTAVVLGDPAGSLDAVVANAASFEDYCRSRGWRVTYFAASPELTEALADKGWRSIQVAEDTVIDLPELEFKGKSWQDVRSAINRAKREGVTMRSLHWADAPRGLRDQLTAIEAQWVGDKSLPEMGFTLGTLEEANDPNVLISIAVDEDGTVHGMTSWMPVYRDGAVAGWTIDIMKRRLDDGVMNGVMEFLIAANALEFKDAGYQFISLSCAPLAYSGEVDSAIEKLLDTLAEKMEPYYGFASLERFKAKFKPRHVPMSLLYRDEAQLPTIALALGRAYLPDATAADFAKAAITRD
ncbi:phosphatidylglycerol lysyltransferase domain-containing protein [Demequina sp. B12]|uniref:phosphatidylglycerol lysyltransferase domain-containing protein n=1 Tax=Demequina sp. B12 TaxID=2992757 RepID=UPI00237AD696|nr:phosphatidylglycerol lysyltransferase domain-containing protein [Demequina sp. B12]MDE0572111.1 phosphatidylglycerol lysyltransferase domain-containing protein [Demequina sp. B12]